MKKIGFEHQGNLTYLVYELDSGDNVDSMSLGMILNNRITGFAPVILTQIDDKKRIKYDVTARVPASQYLLGTVNKKRVLGVFSGIVQALLAAEDYMIDPRTMLLDLDSIFSDVATADTVMLCVPVINQQAEEQPDLRVFFKNILFNAQYDERENQDYVAKLMSHLNGVPAFSVSEFKGILDYLASETAAVAKGDHRPAVQVPIAAEVRPEVERQPAPPVSPTNATGQSKQRPLAAPPASKKTDEASTGTAETGAPTDSISLFYLLQHYNKDNAAKYKAQKEEKKNAKNAGKPASKKQKEAPKPAPQPQSAPGFSIPGQEGLKEAPVLGDTATPQSSTAAAVPPAAPPPHYPPAPLPAQGRPGAVIEETLYFSEDGGEETVLLGQNAPVQKLVPHLVRKRNNERIPVDKAIFRLGRDADYNDYAIVDNRHIGHGHCHIVCRDGEFFLVDDNSKNHTKINGEKIAPGVEVKMMHGCKISIADEEFEFKLY